MSYQAVSHRNVLSITKLKPGMLGSLCRYGAQAAYQHRGDTLALAGGLHGVRCVWPPVPKCDSNLGFTSSPLRTSEHGACSRETVEASQITCV